MTLDAPPPPPRRDRKPPKTVDAKAVHVAFRNSIKLLTSLGFTWPNEPFHDEGKAEFRKASVSAWVLCAIEDGYTHPPGIAKAFRNLRRDSERRNTMPAYNEFVGAYRNLSPSDRGVSAG